MLERETRPLRGRHAADQRPERMTGILLTLDHADLETAFGQLVRDGQAGHSRTEDQRALPPDLDDQARPGDFHRVLHSLRPPSATPAARVVNSESFAAMPSRRTPGLSTADVPV